MAGLADARPGRAVHAEAAVDLTARSEAPSRSSVSTPREALLDALDQFDVIVPTFQKLAAATSIGQLDRQTPCERWTVRDLFGHIIGGATTFAAVVRGDEPPGEVPTGPDDDLSATAHAALIDVDEAFRRPGALERVVATPFGEMPGGTFARLLAFDLLMHAWDLATATDQPLAVPDEVVGEVDAFARAAVTPELRGPNTFGPEVEPSSDASPLERLVAFSGRSR
jgi:uncharacterized protein (TIGR03086 family)